VALRAALVEGCRKRLVIDTAEVQDDDEHDGDNYSDAR